MDEKYFREYDELQGLLIGAYIDAIILNRLYEYSDKDIKNNDLLFLNHIKELCTDDLVLSLTKMYEKGKSNTIEKLNNYVQKQCQQKGIIAPKNKINLGKEQEEIFDRIIHIRNKKVAHNSYGKADIVVDYREMYDLLEHMRNMLNTLCVKELDDRVNFANDELLTMLRQAVISNSFI